MHNKYQKPERLIFDHYAASDQSDAAIGMQGAHVMRPPLRVWRLVASRLFSCFSSFLLVASRHSRVYSLLLCLSSFGFFWRLFAFGGFPGDP